MWEDLIHTTIDNNDDEEQQLFDDNIDDEMPVSVTLSTAAYNNFNEESGLWNFKCRSKHSPRLKDNNELRKNIIKDLYYFQIFQTIPVPVEAVGSSEKMTIITVKMD
ncbi:hypothetical protein DPMN_105248 [Dreissena polymorpha]|uniref:Uncharacterized protein n=1 Tax=Dreissena polymorpha TaxID=45954 RepID=A0A9D4HEH3_DREPO|nr:hypothetical protein DPMN_105248 [Dreissena polymorpha]